MAQPPGNNGNGATSGGCEGGDRTNRMAKVREKNRNAQRRFRWVGQAQRSEQHRLLHSTPACVGWAVCGFGPGIGLLLCCAVWGYASACMHACCAVADASRLHSTTGARQPRCACVRLLTPLPPPACAAPREKQRQNYQELLKHCASLESSVKQLQAENSGMR